MPRNSTDSGPRWVGYAAAAWSVGYGGLALHWTLGGDGFPFGVGHDPAPHLSILGNARREIAAPIIAALGLVGAVVATAMARGQGARRLRIPLIVMALGFAATLALVIPDYRVLVVIAYAPILIIGAPFGWPPNVRFLDAIPWALINQVVCMAGGMVWGATAVVYRRITLGRCGYCGRGDHIAPWTRPDAARRWGAIMVATAVVIPLIYAATRWIWALGIPLGISDEFFREGQAIGLWQGGAALGALAAVGAGLTLGLIRPWGETFPNWIPRFGGSRVPRKLAIVPAALIAIVVTSAGLMFVRVTLTGTFILGAHTITLGENWAALFPELLWPVWGPALGAAALAYYYRTRERCEVCGRL